MKKILITVPLIAAMLMVSCKKDQTADQLIVTDETTLTPAQSPEQAQQEMVSTAQSKPLTNVALSESYFSFGKITKGDQKEHIYEISNTGQNPLIISQVVPGCGCTVPEYTKEPILPGKKGKITLKFDSTDFDGLVQKEAKIYANVEKAPITLTFSADIQPKITKKTKTDL